MGKAAKGGDGTGRDATGRKRKEVIGYGTERNKKPGRVAPTFLFTPIPAGGLLVLHYIRANEGAYDAFFPPGVKKLFWA